VRPKLKPGLKSFRFSLLDLVFAALAYALVLAAVRHFLDRLGLPREVMAPIAIMCLPPGVMAIATGRENMDLFTNKAVALRRLAYGIGTFWPLCFLPAVITTIFMAMNHPSLRNDTGMLLYWLALLLPCLAQFWIHSIKTMRRADEEDTPR